MVYHSSLNGVDAEAACGLAILPIKTAVRGPAPAAPAESDDVIDETLFFFKANVLFRHFELKGNADRVLIYLTLYITQCLKKLEGLPDRVSALKALTSMAHESFLIPGDAGFALGTFFPSPQTSQEADLTRAYLKQLREETGRRLLDKVYGEDGQPSKFWLVFAKRRFMNKSV
uniref:Actin-related protein 2/3 complex subunit 3 n=1 Tax=Chrysotila carterae TaxID=13221 RepID=A0A7S4BNT7_CHRCT